MMNDSGGTSALQRALFFEGQLLAAADLNTLFDFNRQLRWWHNRSLHNWGIAFGLEVLGEKGARVVTVQPGYALDCLGRDLVLTDRLDVPIPAAAGPLSYFLVAAYADDDSLPATQRRGPCDTAGTVRLDERPDLRWVRPDDPAADSRFRPGQDIVLASIQVQNCRLATAAADKERRYAAPAPQPLIASGQTMPGATPWKIWQESGVVLGVQTRVDTARAGFRATPRYMAHIMGNRMQSADLAWDGYGQVSEPSASGFLLQVLLPRDLRTGGNAILNMSGILDQDPEQVVQWICREGAWCVAWMGVEG